jgi:hypothetical protein
MKRQFIFTFVLVFVISMATYAADFRTITVNLQNGVWADVHVTGDMNQYATVEIRTKEGHLGLVMLSPSIPQKTAKSFYLNDQRFFIEQISLTPPSEESNGRIDISCNYTDPSGENLLEFEGELAKWKLGQ